MQDDKYNQDDDLIDDSWWDNAQLESRAPASSQKKDNAANMGKITGIMTADGSTEKGDDSVTREQITEEVKRQINDLREELTKDIEAKLRAEQESRITNLEKKIKDMEGAVNGKLQTDRKYYSNSDNHSGSGKDLSKKNKINMNTYSIRAGYKFGDWIYYVNDEMGDFLYRVRKDGTDNQQLTDYSVFSVFSVKNNKLHFQDRDLHNHTVDL